MVDVLTEQFVLCEGALPLGREVGGRVGGRLPGASVRVVIGKTGRGRGGTGLSFDGVHVRPPKCAAPGLGRRSSFAEGLRGVNGIWGWADQKAHKPVRGRFWWRERDA